VFQGFLTKLALPKREISRVNFCVPRMVFLKISVNPGKIKDKAIFSKE
jgi:hypothetical protein